ncbi:MAG: DPP IV N-terminal domain-containing protein, partial [Bacteroidetes bacterium]|nr:DPP IV N-terminal domain-containing protein [Bacteroidota bacterium]
MRLFVVAFILCCFSTVNAQPGSSLLKWNKEGSAYYMANAGSIVRIDLPRRQETVIVDRDWLRPAGQTAPLEVRNFSFSEDGKRVLIYTNARRVWRYDTRGDYWVMDIATHALRQVGRERPVSSLMFAKLCPDGTKVAYASERNLYVEDLASGKENCLTCSVGGGGGFDWVYEEELECRDGFRWSPDGRHIAYWQIDGSQVKNYLMLNTTDSTYPFVVPVEYPVAGQSPSPYKIGVVDVNTGVNRWMDIPGDARQSYLPRMEWADNSSELVLQQLNRKQNESRLFLSDIGTGKTSQIYIERDSAFIECKGAWQDGVIAGWDWINGGREFLWVTEKDGWRHIYRVSRDGRKETLVTKGDYDIIRVSLVDEKNNMVYFIASPQNATQKYLFRTRLDGRGRAERLT